RQNFTPLKIVSLFICSYITSKNCCEERYSLSEESSQLWLNIVSGSIELSPGIIILKPSLDLLLFEETVTIFTEIPAFLNFSESSISPSRFSIFLANVAEEALSFLLGISILNIDANSFFVCPI